MAVFLGLPIELWWMFGFVLLIMAYMLFKFMIKAIPEKCFYIRKNYSAEYFAAQSDPNGQFLRLYKNRKRVLTVRLKGTPIEVSEGGLRMTRLHVLVEGMEETLEVITKAKEQEEESGYQSAAIHETLGTWEAWLTLMSMAVRKHLSDLILPAIAGAGGAILLMRVVEMFFTSPPA